MKRKLKRIFFLILEKIDNYPFVYVHTFCYNSISLSEIFMVQYLVVFKIHYDFWASMRVQVAVGNHGKN